jgi:hypothetical protein
MFGMSISVCSVSRGQVQEAPELESAASIFTVSRQDFFDYKRCPKIVAIKTYRRTRTKKERLERDESRVPLPNLVGQIGEAAVQLAFSDSFGRKSLPRDSWLLGKVPEKRIAQLVMSRLNLVEKGIQLDLELLAKKTIEGLREIKPEIERALGPLTVIGRGESRYGALPTCGYPDYVIFPTRNLWRSVSGTRTISFFFMSLVNLTSRPTPTTTWRFDKSEPNAFTY